MIARSLAMLLLVGLVGCGIEREPVQERIQTGTGGDSPHHVAVAQETNPAPPLPDGPYVCSACGWELVRLDAKPYLVAHNSPGTNCVHQWQETTNASLVAKVKETINSEPSPAGDALKAAPEE